MSTEHKDTDQNALAARLGNAWTNLKQGKLISYKMMAILLILVAGLGTWWYIAAESRKNNSARWMDLDEASTPGKLKELIDREKDGITARIAEIQQARAELGREGLDLFNSFRPGEDQKGVENVEKAREELAKWLEKAKTDSVLKNDPVFKAQCLWGLGMAEEGLIGVPKDPGPPTGAGPISAATEYRGQVSKAIEYFDQLVELAGANPKAAIPWAEDAKKRAELMRKDPDKFQKTAIQLHQYRNPFTKGDPLGPIAPKKD